MLLSLSLYRFMILSLSKYRLERKARVAPLVEAKLTRMSARVKPRYQPNARDKIAAPGIDSPVAMV